ncbi:MAG: hypothetical protein KG003_08590 [Bacteroidetes bacterium]|nr:hypothetical protein [Bacteroidota bacterium]
MKNSITLSFVFCTFLLGSGLYAQSELPKKKTSGNTQTGGAQKPQNKSGDERPVYQSRPITRNPIMIAPYYFPVYQNNGNQGNQNNNTGPTPEETARYNREMAKNELRRALWDMQSDEQSFVIQDVTKPFEIKGTKGFRVVFPELAFVDSEGNPVLGEVELKMTEFTDNSEFAAANLTTMTTDGQLLETGGMINLEAFSGSDKVQLQNGKTLEIIIPQLNDQKGFQTFYASGTYMVTWSTSPTAQQSDTNSNKKFDGYTIKMLKSKQNLDGKDVTFSIFKNWESLEDYVNSNLKVPTETRANIKKDGIPFLFTIEFNGLGKIKDVKAKYPEYTKNSLISEMIGKIKTILLNAPALSMTDGYLQAGKPYDIMFATAKNYTENIPVMVNMPMSAGKEMPATARETNANPTEKNVNDFAMQGSQLTKINCDRFTNSNSTDTQAFHFERADAIVYVVFKDQRSLIQPTGANGNYVLRKVPTGTNVRYVAVIYGDDGNIQMAVKDAKTENGPVKFDNTEEFKAEKLKKYLNEI